MSTVQYYRLMDILDMILQYYPRQRMSESHYISNHMEVQESYDSNNYKRLVYKYSIKL